MNLKDYERLASNPNYILSPEQVKEFESLRRKQYRRRSSKPKKHSTKVIKHQFELEKAEPNDDHNSVPRN